MKILKQVKEIKSKNGELHFTRFAIFESKYFSIYIHRIYKEDSDKYLHNHPWNFFNIILHGSYSEELENDIRMRFPGNYSYYNAQKHFHKIDYVFSPVTTLVFTGSRYNNWGYKTENGVISNEEYRKLKHGE